MAKKSRFVWVVIFSLILLAAACRGITSEEPSPAPTKEEIILPSVTPLPTELPTATPTATPILTPSPVPLIQPAADINHENVTQLEQFWRIGKGQFEGMCWSHDSQYAALGTGAGVFVMDSEGELLFSHFDGWVEYKQIVFSHDNSLMAVKFKKPLYIRDDMPSFLSIYDLPSGERVSVIDLGVQFDVERIAFQEDDVLIAAGFFLNEWGQRDAFAIVHFDPLTGERLGEYLIQSTISHTDKIEVSDDGDNVLVHFYDEPNMKLYDSFGHQLGSIPWEKISHLSMNGGFLAFNTWEESDVLKVYRVNATRLGTIEVEVGCQNCTIGGFDFDFAGESLFINSYDKSYSRYSLPGLELQEEFEVASYANLYSPDFSRGVGTKNDEFFMTNLETREVLGSISGIQDPMSDIAISPDHSRLFLSFTGYDEDWNSFTAVQVWDTSRMEIEKTVVTQLDTEWGDEIESITILEDGKTLAIHKEESESLEFWDVNTGEKVDTFSFSESAWTVGLSHDGQFVMGADKDWGVEIWNRETKELVVDEDEIYQIIGFYSPIFTRDNQLAIVGGSDTLVIWDLTSSVLPIPYELEGNGVLAVNPEGTLLAHYRQNAKEIHFYDLVEKKPISVFDWDPLIRGMVFNADGTLLIINTYKGMFFWDVEAGEVVHMIEYYASEMTLSGDGMLLITMGGDGTVRLWGIP